MWFKKTISVLEILDFSNYYLINLVSCPKVEAIQTEAVRLQAAYAGGSMQEIQTREVEVVNAWRDLHFMVDTRRNRLADASDLYRFLLMAKDLMLWMDDITRQMNTQEKPR